MIASTIAASIAVPNPSTLKPGTKLLVIRSKIAFMTKVNKPKVKIFIGNVKITNIGLRKIVSIPHKTATTKSVGHPLIVTPGITYAVI